MAHESFRKAVIDKVAAIAVDGGGEASVGEVSSALFIQTRQAHKRLLNTLSELTGEGLLVRVRQGVYGPPPAAGLVAGKPVDKREVMWRVLRMRKRVTVEDLVEMAGASKDYAREWLLMLVNREIARKVQEPGKAGVWVLIHDSQEMPENTGKAARLREIRMNKKKIMARLEAIDAAAIDIRTMLSTIEDA